MPLKLQTKQVDTRLRQINIILPMPRCSLLEKNDLQLQIDFSLSGARKTPARAVLL